MLKTLECIILMHFSATTCHGNLPAYYRKYLFVILNVVNLIYSARTIQKEFE